MVFGIRAVMEAIEHGKEIESLYVQRGLTGPLISDLKKQLQQHGITYQSVPIEKLNRLTRKNHQGVVGFISPITYQHIEDIIPGVFESGAVPLVLILDSITDVRNLGAIVRTAECAGVHAVIVPKRASAQINPDAIKTSAGALFTVPVCRVDRLEEAAKFLQASGLSLIACTEKTTEVLYAADYTLPCVLILGAEDQGISDGLIRMADHLARIPMLGSIASLNVSVSAGVILYEAVRQRLNADV